MKSVTLREIDNRTPDDLIVYYEARIEALVRRVHELEKRLAQEEARDAQNVPECQ